MNPLAIATAGPYNVFLLLGLSAGFVLAWRHGEQSGAARVEWTALLAFVVTAALVGSRLLHFDSGAAPGSKTILGGVLLATVALFGGVRSLRLDPRSPDALALALPIGFAIGRIGCLLAGCCFGHPTDLPWGAVYDQHSAAFRAQLAAGLIPADATASLPAHPTQLYEATLALMVAGVVPRIRRIVRRPGSLLLAVLIALATGRLLLEFVRARDIMPFAGLTQVQWLIAGATSVAALLLFLRERRPAAASAAALVRSRGHAVRFACIASAPALILVGGGLLLAPLERLVLALVAVPSIWALLSFRVWPAARRGCVLATPAALSCAALLFALQQAGDSTGLSSPYPRTSRSFGMNFAVGDTWQTRITGTNEGFCGPYPVFETLDARYRAAGVAFTQTTDFRQRRRTSVRLSGFAGSENVEPRPSAGLSGTSARLGGVGGRVTFDRGWFGFTGGLALGTFSSDSKRANHAGIGGLRVGRAEGLHAFTLINDVEPVAVPKTTVRAGLGYAFGSTGSAIRAGAWLTADDLVESSDLFVSGAFPVNRFVIEPSVVLSDHYDVRLTVSRRISLSSPAGQANAPCPGCQRSDAPGAQPPGR